ncbi:hypothetical protein RND81_01G011900 [Saponaria officinalis]|uniref:Exostosin GT47 domain-containing protein n=1 Tax=Saponaria officinalis TaxID=3572 RepID=A0AAW1NB55_SAPOF
MIPSRFGPNHDPNHKFSNPKTVSKKVSHAYKLVGSNDKPVAAVKCCSISWYVVVTCSVLGLLLLLFCLNSSLFFSNDINLTLDAVENARKNPSTNVKVIPYVQSLDQQPAEKLDEQNAGKLDECAGKYIYVLDVPSEFNSDLLENCSVLSPWTDMCQLLKNSGLGPRLDFSDENVFSGSDWFTTDQFSLEVIFHNRMKQYKCLTNDYSKASAVFVPYYSGLDVGRYLWNLNATLRDATSVKMAKYLSQRPEWKVFGGRDHFLIVGRITWDFRRQSENTSEYSGWGNRLFHIPEIQNMTSLLLELSPKSKFEIAVPYPTFFHPSSENEVHIWQEKMRQKRRPYLFSFAGAPRPNLKESIRNVIIKECLASEGNRCKFVNCKPNVTDCSKPETVMKLFQSSVFCLQPPGDSYTRKSIFDTILAGCIPIFLHPASAYVQYIWHLPKDYSSYSVFIPMDELKNGNITIEKRLLQIPKKKVVAMREEVIKLIPRIVYANPNSKVDGFEDAFDVAVKGVLNRVAKFKSEMEGGKNGTFESVPDELAWKYNFFGDLENREWDKYFGDSFGIQ